MVARRGRGGRSEWGRFRSLVFAGEDGRRGGGGTSPSRVSSATVPSCSQGTKNWRSRAVVGKEAAAAGFVALATALQWHGPFSYQSSAASCSKQRGAEIR